MLTGIAVASIMLHALAAAGRFAKLGGAKHDAETFGAFCAGVTYLAAAGGVLWVVFALNH